MNISLLAVSISVHSRRLFCTAYGMLFIDLLSGVYRVSISQRLKMY